jgi:hypothetical protein
LMTSRATIGAVADRDAAKGHRLDQPQDPHPLFRRHGRPRYLRISC